MNAARRTRLTVTVVFLMPNVMTAKSEIVVIAVVRCVNENCFAISIHNVVFR